MPPAKKCPAYSHPSAFASSCPFLFKPKKWPWHIQTDFLHLMAKCLLLLVMSLYVSITSSIRAVVASSSSSSSSPVFLTRFISISMPRIAHHLSFPCHHAPSTLHNGVVLCIIRSTLFLPYIHLGCKNCYIVHHFLSDTSLTQCISVYLYMVDGVCTSTYFLPCNRKKGSRALVNINSSGRVDTASKIHHWICNHIYWYTLTECI